MFFFDPPPLFLNDGYSPQQWRNFTINPGRKRWLISKNPTLLSKKHKKNAPPLPKDPPPPPPQETAKSWGRRTMGRWVDKIMKQQNL